MLGLPLLRQLLPHKWARNKPFLPSDLQAKLRRSRHTPTSTSLWTTRRRWTGWRLRWTSWSRSSRISGTRWRSDTAACPTPTRPTSTIYWKKNRSWEILSNFSKRKCWCLVNRRCPVKSRFSWKERSDGRRGLQLRRRVEPPGSATGMQSSPGQTRYHRCSPPPQYPPLIRSSAVGENRRKERLAC